VQHMELTISNLFQTLWQSTSIAAAGAAQWKDWIMVVVALILLYLGIFKKIEPLLLVPIGLVPCFLTYRWQVGIFVPGIR